MTSPDVMPLVDAAYRLRVPYSKALQLLLTGVLDGGKTRRGRWVVRRSSVERLARERELAAAETGTDEKPS